MALSDQEGHTPVGKQALFRCLFLSYLAIYYYLNGQSTSAVQDQSHHGRKILKDLYIGRNVSLYIYITIIFLISEIHFDYINIEHNFKILIIVIFVFLQSLC